MRHTVIGLFDTYAQADSARNTLVQTGFAHSDVELQANPEPATDAAAAADESPGVLANIERFFASLFSTSGSNAPAAERYTDAVRRGAVLVCVNATSEAHAALAHDTLTRLGAIDVSKRSASWDAQQDDGETRREHSMLDELGIGSPAAVPTAAQPPLDPLRAAEEERKWARVDAPPRDTPPDDDPSRAAAAYAAASVPGSGAVLRPDLVDTERDVREVGEVRAAGEYQPPPTAPRDDFSRTSGSGIGTPGERDRGLGADEFRQSQSLSGTSSSSGASDDYRKPSPGVPPAPPDDYPATTVQGAAGYQSDPSEIGRASGMSGQHQSQRNAPPTDYRSPQSPAAAGYPPASSGARADEARDSRSAFAAAEGGLDSVGGGIGAPIPDEFLEYEEDFRTHYDEQYGTSEGARYDEYVSAYRYGATMGRDMRYRDRPWDDVELEARQDWERSSPEGNWERFKAAVRHGWERVTGHHHHPH